MNFFGSFSCRKLVLMQIFVQKTLSQEDFLQKILLHQSDLEQNTIFNKKKFLIFIRHIWFLVPLFMFYAIIIICVFFLKFLKVPINSARLRCNHLQFLLLIEHTKTKSLSKSLDAIQLEKVQSFTYAWDGLDWIVLDAGSRGNESILFVNNVMLQCSGKKKLFPHGLVVYKKRVLQEFVPRAVAIKSNHFNLSLFWKALGFVATKFPSRYH